ncbi:hypothetical protein [Pontibacter sp. G13]|uniref:hypothetical protein n=1 Tax=Pontibacter sp. G13 TaxID=3074898 RepID=UPI00288C066D|nr:hypothetical protein [Pontibacter sp. G13]WNJ20442.1 hypothetical protein RJD25_08170 [Pontibacter sp. G13]
MNTRISSGILLICLALIVSTCVKPIKYDAADIPPFEGLEAPSSTDGYQIHVPPFPVPARFEREIFLRMPVGNHAPMYVNKFEVKCRPGTHHMIAYGYQDENDPANPAIGVMRDQNLPDGRPNFSLTMGSGAMYCGAQEPDFTLDLPDGVAMYVPANASMDINSHYFNVSDEIIFGEVYLNMHTIPFDEVEEVLYMDDINNQRNLILPPNQTTVVTREKIFKERTEIRQLFSHMHKRGKMFQVYRVGGSQDGELVYTALDYQHPPYVFFDPPLTLDFGEGLRTVVTYENETDREIRYGVTSEDEMGILFFTRRF